MRYLDNFHSLIGEVINNLQRNNINGINNSYVLQYFISNIINCEKISIDIYYTFLCIYIEFNFLWIILVMKDVYIGFNELLYSI